MLARVIVTPHIHHIYGDVAQLMVNLAMLPTCDPCHTKRREPFSSPLGQLGHGGRKRGVPTLLYFSKGVSPDLGIKSNGTRVEKCSWYVYAIVMNSEPLTDLVIQSLQSQYRAALATLSQCIESADDDTWAAEHLDGPVNRVVFHTLVFADVYLDWGEDAFLEQQFHRDNPQLFQDYEELEDVPPSNFYGKADCRAYLEHCLRKVDQTLRQESLQVLVGESGCRWRKNTRLALHIYNIRHIQHHAAQLGLRRQLSGGEPLRWETGE